MSHRRPTKFTPSNEMGSEGGSTEQPDAQTRRNGGARTEPPPLSSKTDRADGDAENDKGTAPKREYKSSDKTTAQRRAAAEKSTGPKTAEGKATSSRNGVTHGMTAFKTSTLVKGEDPAAYEELYQALGRQYPPLGPIGEYAVVELRNALWRSSQRINLAEASLIMKERERVATDQMMDGLTAARPAEHEPDPHQLDTAAGVAEVLQWVAMTVEDFPSSMNETDDE